MHTPAQAGQTAKPAPDFAAGIKNRDIKARKNIFNFIIPISPYIYFAH